MRLDIQGRTTTVADFMRFDLAEAYAETIAESLARNDHDRWRRGVSTSGTRAIIVEPDVWLIDPSRPTPIVLTVSEGVPRPRALREALGIIRNA